MLLSRPAATLYGHVGGEHSPFNFPAPRLRRQGVGAMGQRILRPRGLIWWVLAICSAVCPMETGGVLSHGRGHRQQVPFPDAGDAG